MAYSPKVLDEVRRNVEGILYWHFLSRALGPQEATSVLAKTGFLDPVFVARYAPAKWKKAWSSDPFWVKFL